MPRAVAAVQSVPPVPLLAAAMTRLASTLKPPTKISPLVARREHVIPDPSPEQRTPLLAAAAAAAAVAVAAVAGPRPALALSGGSVGGCSDSESSYGGDDSTTDSLSWPWDNAADQKTHESVGTAASPPPPSVFASPYWFWGAVAMFFGALFLVARYCPPETTTTVVKLQVALRGVATAKSLQKDLNRITDKVDDNVNSWKDHFNKISVGERGKFDEETLTNLQGIKRKKVYSKKTDGSKNEYTVLTILTAADGILDFPKVIRSVADLKFVLAKLDSTPEADLRGVHVLRAPQDEDDILSSERMQKDYPYQKPLSGL